MQQELREMRTGIDRDQAMQGRKYKGMLPADESLPNRHHHASQAQMDIKIDATKEQIGKSTKKDRSWFGFIIEIILSPFRTKHIEPHRIHGDYNYVENRSLPVSTLIDILKMKYGKDDIHEGNLIPALYDIFGEDASPTVKNIAKFGWDSPQQGGGESEGHAGNLGMVCTQEAYSGSTRNNITDCRVLLSVRQTDQEAAEVSRSAGD